MKRFYVTTEVRLAGEGAERIASTIDTVCVLAEPFWMWSGNFGGSMQRDCWHKLKETTLKGKFSRGECISMNEERGSNHLAGDYNRMFIQSLGYILVPIMGNTDECSNILSVLS